MNWLLVIIGFLQFCALIGQVVIYCRQAKIMARQAHEMKQQRRYMRLQWKTMGEQVAEMQGSAKQTAKLIEHAGTQADAALEGACAAIANVETIIGKERARIKVRLHPFEIHQPNILLGHSVSYSVICLGPTIASIDYAVAEATVNDSKEPPTDDIVFGGMAIGPFISPGSPPVELTERTPVLSQADTTRIAQSLSFLHFRGWIKYRDFMERERETAFCYTWKITGIPHFLRSEWEKSGLPEANRET